MATYGRKSTAENVTEGLDLSGKTAVVTGVNSGISTLISPRSRRAP